MLWQEELENREATFIAHKRSKAVNSGGTHDNMLGVSEYYSYTSLRLA